MVNGWASPNPSTDNYTVLNLGQLKSIAQPFYDRLNAAGYTITPPWTASLTDGDDYSLVNLGQLKNAFSFKIPLLPPINLIGAAGSGQASLSWTAASGATSYKVLRSTTNGNGYADFAGNTVTAPTTTLINTGLNNGTTYYYVVTAIDGGATSGNSNQATVTPVAPPVAPTGLTAIAGNAQITLSWTASVGASSYKVQRSTINGSGYTDFIGNTINAPTVTLTNTGLTNGTPYYYVVTATNAGGVSSNSAQATATPIAPPATPTGFNATAGNALINLNWAAVSGAASYKIQRSTTNGSGYADFASNTVAVPTTTLTNTGLTNGTTYYYVIVAINGSGSSAISAQVNATPTAAPTAPTAPTGLIAVAGNAQATLNWTASAGATSYKVQRSTTNGSGYADFAGNTTASPAVTLIDIGLTNATTYYYVVMASNENGTSGNSNQASVTPLAPPATPTGFTAAAGNAQITLSWTESPGASSYKIRRSTTSGSGYVDFAGNTTAGPTITLTNTGLTNGTTYYYVVTASNASGTSGDSNQASATPMAIPEPPTGLTAIAGDAQAILSWTASAGASSYKVQRSTTNGSGYADFAGNATTAANVTLTNSGLTNGSTYYYVVTASNATGTSGNSNQASATPTAIPSAPTELTALAGNEQVSLSWSIVPGADVSYTVKRSTVSGGPYTIIVTSLSKPKYFNPNLTNGTTYYYAVNAVRAGLVSLDSTQVSAKPIALPAVPTGVTAVSGNAAVTLSWSPVNGATQYVVKRSTTSGTDYKGFSGNTITNNTLTDTQLINGTTYYYVVAARNLSGMSIYSGEIAVVPNTAANPAAKPVAPTNFRATRLSPGKVRYEWDDNSNNETAFIITDEKGVEIARVEAGVESVEVSE